jgi:hypothetical protein
LTEKLERLTFGAWKELLAIAKGDLLKKKGQTRCILSELPLFALDKWLRALEGGEDKPKEKLIALLHLIVHAGRFPEERAQALLNAHRQRFKSLARDPAFLAGYALIACPRERPIAD